MNCYNLSSIVIGANVTDLGSDYNSSDDNSSNDGYVVTRIIYNGLFGNCKNLTSIEVDKNNQHYKSIDGNLYSKDGKTLIRYAIGKAETHFDIPNGVTSIDFLAFEGCDNIQNITIPDSVTSIGSFAFWRCNNLASITIPDSVNSIKDHTFSGCYRLSNIVIPDSVTSIGYSAFGGCNSLTDIYYTGTKEDWKKIEIDYSYEGNDYLKNATIHYNYVPEE